MTVVGLHPEELFDKMLDGELLPVERERLRAHLDSCQVCRFEYAARLDFQQEALELSAASLPPALPLRPLAAADLPLASVAPVTPRRRRLRRLVWGLAAAALITAGGAVASGVVGKTPWRTVSLMLSRTATPAERSAPVAAKPPARGSVVASPAADFDALLVDAQPVAQAPLADGAPLPAHDAVKHQGSVARASLQVTSPRAKNGETVSAKDDAAAKDAPAKEPVSAAKLFGEANQARRAGDIGRASGLYHLLQDQFPGSPEADLSRVTLALLLLDSGDAQGALSGFERYLAGSSRGLEAEALVGRARALGRLGRRDLEAAAWSEVRRKYPRSIYGRQAGERLLALGQP